MKTLSIWIDENNNIPENIKCYLASVVKFTPDAEHFLITNSGVAIPGMQTLDLAAERKRAEALLGNVAWWDAYCTENMFIADMLRLAWAITIPELLYLDADVELIGAPIITPGRIPGMGQTCGYQEFFLFYSDGAADWFQNLVDYTTTQEAKPMEFMRTFLKIKFGKCLSKPAMMEKTFYIRH